MKQRKTIEPLSKIFKRLSMYGLQEHSRRKKNLILKILGISKIVYLSLIITVLNSILEEIQKVQKTFLWYSCKPKSNHNTLCNTFEDGGLKNVDAKSKIISLQCSWVKTLYDGNHCDWKIIPLYCINKYFGKNFYFHSNLSFNLALVDSFPEFLNKSLLIGVIKKLHLAFDPIFYSAINIY